MPLSRTDTTTSPSSRRAVSQIWPPSSVYLMALLSKLANI